MEEPFGGFVVEAVTYRFCGIDGTASTYGNHRVDGWIRFDEFRRFIESSDGGVFADFAECAGVTRAEEGLEGLDERGLGGEGGTGYDEGFAS